MTDETPKPWMRVGYVSPHPLVDTLPYEFYLMAPPGLMMMAACIEISDYTKAAVEDQLEVLDRRIDDLMKRGAGRIVISGVPLALALGRSRTLELLDTLSRRTGVPADTDLEAIIAGAKRLGIRRVGLATRWKEAMTDTLAGYLAECGIEATAVRSSGRSMVENASLDDETGMRLAEDLGSAILDGPNPPDGLIMPGGRWITVAAVRALEARYGRPVITNYAAGLWATLRDHAPARRVRGWGMLLETSGQGND